MKQKINLCEIQIYKDMVKTLNEETDILIDAINVSRKAEDKKTETELNYRYKAKNVTKKKYERLIINAISDDAQQKEHRKLYPYLYTTNIPDVNTAFETEEYKNQKEEIKNRNKTEEQKEKRKKLIKKIVVIGGAISVIILFVLQALYSITGMYAHKNTKVKVSKRQGR